MNYQQFTNLFHSQISICMCYMDFRVSSKTSHCVWHTLEQALASSSNSHIIQLHGSFQNLHQGDDDHHIFAENKGLFDELLAVHQPLSLPDFNLYVLYGFQGEFKDLMASLFIKAEPFSYVDIFIIIFLLISFFIKVPSNP